MSRNIVPICICACFVRHVFLALIFLFSPHVKKFPPRSLYLTDIFKNLSTLMTVVTMFSKGLSMVNLSSLWHCLNIYSNIAFISSETVTILLDDWINTVKRDYYLHSNQAMNVISTMWHNCLLNKNFHFFP